jgi:hypothetical protein
MVKGTIVDASASRTEYVAEVSVMLDCNRRSDVRRKGAKKSGFDLLVEDIGVPMNILSRMTYIVEIPRDLREQINVAHGVAMGRGRLSEAEIAVLKEKMRLYQVYCAMVRDRFRTVTISVEIRQMISQRVLAAANLPQSHFERHDTIADFITRTMDDALMLVQAHARLHGRSEAILADFEGIYPFIWRKFDWLKTIMLGGQVETAVVDANAAARRSLIRLRLKTFRQTTCTVQDIRRRCGLRSASEATIAADLRAILGEPAADGTYAIVLREDDRG